MSRLDLKIFLSSPGDVSDERALARTVLDRLSQEFALRNRIHIEKVSWDDPGAPVPMDAHLTPQQAIDNRRPKPSQCDVVVVMLWSRMGTPLPPEHRKPDGTPYVSGTEYEFCDAMDAAKRTGKPTVLVYRRTEEPRIGLGDRDLDEKRRQYKPEQQHWFSSCPVHPHALPYCPEPCCLRTTWAWCADVHEPVSRPRR